MTSTRTKYLGFFAILVILALTFLVLEIVAGSVSDTALIREEARKFREEAAFLRISTLNLVPSLQHEFKPNYRASDNRIPPNSPRLFRTDALGFIRTGKEESAPPKILFLGGSTTESNEVDEPRRFPAVVEAILRDGGIAVRSLNAGIRGHTTQDSINALLNRPGMQEATLVVMMHNINDRLRLALSGGYHASLGNDPPTSALAILESLRGVAFSSWDYLSYRSNLLFLARSAITKFNPWNGETTAIPVNERNIDFSDPNFEAHQRLFERNLRVFITIARTLGMRAVLMTQPLGIHSEPHAAFNESVRSIAAETDAVLIDLDALLPEPKSWAFLSDNIHFSNRGSETVGRIIAEKIAPLLGAAIKPKPVDTGVVPPDELASRCRAPSEIVTPGPVRQIVAEQGRYPSLSSDGRWLLFQSWKDGRDRIKVLDIPQRRVLELTPKQSEKGERHPAFLSLGESEFEVVFGQGFDERNPTSKESLMVRHWPSMSTRPLLKDQKLSGAIPAVAKNEVLFAGQSLEEPASVPDLYRFKIGRNSVSKITDTKWEEWRPAIAPDGTIYFIANALGNFDIYELSPGASQSALFYGSPADEWDPAVSPEGKWLAFASKQQGTWDIYVAPTASPGSTIRVTEFPAEEWDPQWDPKGKLLIFAMTTRDGPRIMGTCLFGELN